MMLACAYIDEQVPDPTHDTSNTHCSIQVVRYIRHATM